MTPSKVFLNNGGGTHPLGGGDPLSFPDKTLSQQKATQVNARRTRVGERGALLTPRGSGFRVGPPEPHMPSFYRTLQGELASAIRFAIGCNFPQFRTVWRQDFGESSGVKSMDTSGFTNECSQQAELGSPPPSGSPNLEDFWEMPFSLIWGNPKAVSAPSGSFF